MASQQRQVVQEPRTEPTGCLPGLLRFIWMAVGNMALIASAMLVAKGTAPVVMDIVFLAVTIGLIVVRYVDITRFKGETSEGQPATLVDWRRYAILLAILSTTLWALARFAASRG
jgi:hypothetical protein